MLSIIFLSLPVAVGNRYEDCCLHHSCMRPPPCGVSARSCVCMQTLALNVTIGDGTVEYTVRCPTRKQGCPDLAPAPPCPQSCSGNNGVCQQTESGFQCECESAWTGADCGEYQCAGEQCELADVASGEVNATVLHGECASGVCACDEGFTGVDCRMPEPTCDADCTELVCPLCCDKRVAFPLRLHACPLSHDLASAVQQGGLAGRQIAYAQAS